MKPSMRAFTEELMFLKMSEAVEPEEGKKPEVDKAKLWAQALLNWGGYGAGFGLGTGLGYVTAEKLMPKTLRPETRTLAGVAAGVLGGLGSLAAWDAFRKARQSEDDAAERDDQGL
jgi:hypothetical protein